MAMTPRAPRRAGVVLACLVIGELVTGSSLAAAPSLPPGFEPGERVTVKSVRDGDTVVVEGGREIRLIGIQAPKRPLGRSADLPWPLADQARAALERLALGRQVTVHFDGRRGDRHGLILAHLVDGHGRWLQAEMLAQGLARVYTFPDNRRAAAEMLAIEDKARRTRLGIWRDPHYRVVSSDQARRFVDSFQLVEGRVVQVQTISRKVFLNFGSDWRTDFTIEVPPAIRRDLARRGIDTAGLKDVKLRVRGWIKLYNGPLIELTHPEQIEVLAR